MNAVKKSWAVELREAKMLLDNRYGSQKELAAFMGVAPQRLTEIFSGGRNPRVDRLDAFRLGIERERKIQRRLTGNKKAAKPE